MDNEIIFGTNTTIYGCGCKTVSVPRIGIDKTYTPSYPCYDCQQEMIGKRIDVIRFGAIPVCGQSYNCRDNKREKGVSCYLTTMRFRPEFTDRKKYKFSAIIIGWGGDDEPLVNAETII